MWTTAIARFLEHAVVVGVLVLVIGELWFRLPWTTKILVYEFDAERNYRLVGGQSRGLGLGNFSVVSPRISINSDGFRNTEIDWTAPAVLAVGSSQLLGPGLEDDEVWTAIVGDRLSAVEGRPIIVVNAGAPGYGPYHQAVTVRRYLERYPPPYLLVVRAAVSDRAFPRPTTEELDALRRHMALSSRMRRYSEFVPFLVNKLAAQVGAIRDSFAPHRAPLGPLPDEGPAAADAMWRSEARWWHEIVDVASGVGIPVLLFVDGSDGAPSALRLTELLGHAFQNRGGDVTVALLGARETGLDIADHETRWRQYREQFLLSYDPHANARLHRVTAEFLAPIVAARGMPRPSRHTTAQPPARTGARAPLMVGQRVERDAARATASASHDR